MPAQLVTNNIPVSDVPSGDLGYKYPGTLDLRPDSPLHKDLVGKLLSRARRSQAVMSSRYPAWKEVDETLDGYIPADEAEAALKAVDRRKPISIVVPASYAMLEVLMAYMSAVFLEEPYFRYKGYEDEDVVGAMLLEKVIMNTCRRFKVGLSLYTLLRDSFAYGIGIATPVWDRLYRRGMSRKPEQMDLFSALQGEQDTESEMRLAFEGVRVDNVDPYLYLPDPAVSIHQVQRGEFVGWVLPTTRMALLREEAYDETMFNVRYIPKDGAKSSLRTDETGRSSRTGISGSSFSEASVEGGHIDVMWMYVDLIPKEWELGTQDRPEKWLFGLAGDSIIIKASPVRLNHEMFPVVTAAPTFTGYTAAPIGSMEQIAGLQTVLSFMLNSHVTNVRKSMNDMLVVDPLLVNMNDISNPGPGRLIRLRRRNWGHGVKDAIQQLQVTDVTRQNVQDIPILMELMERVLGISANMQGSINMKKERVAAQESRQSHGMGMARLDKSVKLFELQALYDLADMTASQTQQLMSMDQYVELVGRYEEELRAEYGADKNRLKVSPQDYQVLYDIVPYTATMPGLTDGEGVLKMFELTVGTPSLAGLVGADIRRLYMHVWRSLGVRNVQDFMQRAQVSVRPDAEVANEAQNGNLIPVGGLGGQQGVVRSAGAGRL